MAFKYGSNSSKILFSGNYFYPGNPLFDKSFSVDEKTLFDIASLTKLVTATAILILVSRGKLSLDDEIDEILKTKIFKGIKIRHLLSHTSGPKIVSWLFKRKKQKEMEEIILSAGKGNKTRRSNLVCGPKLLFTGESN